MHAAPATPPPIDHLSGGRRFEIVVIGGGHAGVEAAWAAANILGTPASVALITLDPAKIGVMSCNPAIGGLAKGQIVREIDAMGGLMGLATDATGIQFKMLNTSKGAAVHGPRAQCDKHAYARQVQALIASRSEIVVIPGSVERLLVESAVIRGVVIARANDAEHFELAARAVILTTGTFMRGLMHTGESKTPGGRHGEAAAFGISGALSDLGFELGRLKTGTPPRLKQSTIDWDALKDAPGDEIPVPFSDLTLLSDTRSTRALQAGQPCHLNSDSRINQEATPSLRQFPVLEQILCKSTSTTPIVNEIIRANLHRAPMYSGQIESAGPRYCPSIEDKVVRFADRETHNVFLEPESLEDDWIYCNGISTSLPSDVQDIIVRSMPGCARAHIYRYGYAVEYDMVRPHQIHATGMTKLIRGLFLAGQINGTSGYEEAAAQGLVAGINAARLVQNATPITFGRDQAYIGVLMDDLVTKTPVEPYRMFTSRAEHRLLLRADNAPDRLTPLAIDLGLLATTGLGRLRQSWFEHRRAASVELHKQIDIIKVGSTPLRDMIKRPEFTFDQVSAAIGPLATEHPRTAFTVYTDRFYEPFIARQHVEVRRAAELERKTIPDDFDFAAIASIRTEARAALGRFRPATLGQAGRLEGLTPSDITLLSVLVERHKRSKN